MSEHTIKVGDKELSAKVTRHANEVLYVALALAHDEHDVVREVASQGETEEEALANLREALELFFEPETKPEG